MMSLVVKHGLSKTLAIVKSFHLAILSTEKIELMGISTSLSSNQIEIDAESKFVAAKVLSSKHVIIFAATYHQPNSDQTYMDTFNQTIYLCHKISNMPILIGIA